MLKQKSSSAEFPHLSSTRTYLRIRLAESCKKMIDFIEQERLDDIGFSVGSETRPVSASATILIERTILGALNDMSRKIVVEEMFKQLATKQGAVFVVHNIPQANQVGTKTVTLTAKRVVTQH